MTGVGQRERGEGVRIISVTSKAFKEAAPQQHITVKMTPDRIEKKTTVKEGEGKHARCGGLNENGLHWFIYLNAQ